MEVAMTGLSTGPHPMAAYRAALRREGIRSSADSTACPTGIKVRVAGLVVVHQAPPTAKGFHFLTLEDECGFINVIVRSPVYARYRTVIRTHPLLLVDSEVQQEGEVVNVVATRVTCL
jgi:error-prone DNA polymerase